MVLNSPQYEYKRLHSLGTDVFISANVEIRRPHLASIGSHIAIDTGFYCTTRLEIGDYIHIAPYVTVIGGEQGLLKMDHFSGIAAGSRIVCGSEEYLGEGLVGPTMPDKYRDKIIIAPVVFERFSTIGSNVVVMPGVTLGEGSVVGACALVTKDTEPWTIYTGIPAKAVKARRRDKILMIAHEMGYD